MSKLAALSPAKLKAWTKVNGYLVKNPESSITDACKNMGVRPSAFYAAKSVLKLGKKRKYSKIAKMQTIEIPHVAVQTPLVAFVGQSEMVVKSVRDLLG